MIHLACTVWKGGLSIGIIKREAFVWMLHWNGKVVVPHRNRKHGYDITVAPTSAQIAISVIGVDTGIGNKHRGIQCID